MFFRKNSYYQYCIKISLSIFLLIIFFSARHEQITIQTENKSYQTDESSYKDYKVNKAIVGKKEETTLISQTQINFTSPIKHQEDITSLCFSPDGSVIALGDKDKSVKLWSLNRSGELIQSLDNSERVSEISYSPDGKEIAVRIDDGTINIWEEDDLTKKFYSRRNITSLPYLSKSVYAPDGQKLVTGSKRHLRLWNRSKHDEWSFSYLNTPDEDIWVRDIGFSPDGRLMATSHRGFPYIRIWNGTSGAFIRSISASNNTVDYLDFSFDRSILASSSVDSSISFWNVGTGELLNSIPNAHNSPVTTLSFSPRLDILASASSDTDIKIWDVNNYQILGIFKGHTEKINVLSFSPSGNILASAGDGGEVFFWNMNPPADIKILSSTIKNANTVSYSVDGTSIAVSTSNSIEVYRNVSNDYLLDLNLPYSEPITILSFSEDDRFIGTGSMNGNITLLNSTSGGKIWEVNGHLGEITGLIFSNDNNFIMTSSSDGMVKSWFIENGTLFNNIIDIPGSVYSLAYSPYANILAIGTVGESLLLVNVLNGNRFSTNFDISNRINAIGFSSDGSILATGDSNGSVNLWNVSSGDNLFHFSEYHSSPVQSVAISQDGKRLISGGLDGRIFLWNLIDFNLLQEFIDVNSQIYSVMFSPNDNSVVSGSNSNLIIWPLNPVPLDIDSDGILDSWERKYNLNQVDPWDQFDDPDNDYLINSMEFFLGTDPQNFDSDNDSIPDGWEHLMGLNFSLDDANKDSDGDSISNLYEYQHGLNARYNDAFADQDGDLMPNFWEFRYNLSASLSDDAKFDPDGDWICNVDEYQGGSNPHDFWSVPVLYFSIWHFTSLLVISFLLAIIGVFQYFSYRKRLVTSTGAPNYSVARLIRKARYPNYTVFLQSDTEATELVASAHLHYLDGNTTLSIQQYYQALSISERLLKHTWMAEIIYQISKTLLIQEKLTSESEILFHLPKPRKNDPMINSYRHMLKALVFEAEKDWINVKNEWKSAKRELKSEKGPKYTKLILRCKRALVEVELRQWLNNPSGAIPSDLILLMKEWQQECLSGKDYESYCSLLILKARMFLAAYQFDESIKILDQCEEIASDINFQLYLNLISLERKKIGKHKQRISALIEAEKFFSPEERIGLIDEYIKMASDYTKDFEE